MVKCGFVTIWQEKANQYRKLILFLKDGEKEEFARNKTLNGPIVITISTAALHAASGSLTLPRSTML